MKISISLSLSPCAMPQIMFAGKLTAQAPMLAAMGYQGLDLFIPDPKGTDIREVARILADAGLETAMLAAQGDIMADDLYLNEPDPARLEVLLERSRLHLEMAATLKTRPNLGFIRGRLPDQDREASLGRMAQGVARYCELAASFGVDVLLEPICRYEINSANSTAEALELMALAGDPPNLGLLLDLFHMNIEDPSVCGAVARAGGRIGHVHFVDNTRGVPGSGSLPLGAVVDTLLAGGYRGFLGIEAVPGPDPEGEAKSGLAFTRALLRGGN